MAKNPFEETATAGGQRGYTAPSRSYNEPPSERVWEPSRRDEPTVTTGGEREYIRSPILKRNGDVQGPPLPPGFLSKHIIPRFRSTREFEKWKAFQKRKEDLRRNYELLRPFLTEDEDITQELSAWYGPLSGSVSVDPTVGLESLIGTTGLNLGPFSGRYTGGPGTNEMIDLAAGVGPVSAYYSPTTDYGTLQGGMNFGPFSIGGGIDTLKNKQLALQLGLEFSKGGIVNLL